MKNRDWFEKLFNSHLSGLFVGVYSYLLLCLIDINNVTINIRVNLSGLIAILLGVVMFVLGENKKSLIWRLMSYIAGVIVILLVISI